MEQKRKQAVELLMSCLTYDVTDFIGLSIQELRNLPKEKKLVIQGFKYSLNNSTDTEIIEIRLVDKSKILDVFNKTIGLYDEKTLKTK